MVKKKLKLFFLFFTYIYLILFSNFIFANPNTDQWEDSEKNYKDLIDEGFSVKAYDITSIEASGGFKILLFVTVLQKDKEVYECQEYQTIDEYLETLELSIVCRKLVQPYERGVGT